MPGGNQMSLRRFRPIVTEAGTDSPPSTAHDDRPATPGARAGNPRRRALGEFGALGATTAIWAVAQPLGLHVPVLAAFITLWMSYFLLRAWRDPSLLREWGVIPKGWGRATRLHASASLLALIVVGALGAARGTLELPPHAWFIVVAYPTWAWCQQFMLQNAVVANAAHLGTPKRVLPVVGAVAFGGAHLPDVPLAGLTMLGGLLWTWLFLRAPNLWLLAIGHTVVGIAAFLWVLGRDPLEEFPQLLEWLG